MNKRQLIKEFLNKVREAYFIPEYSRNLKAKNNNVLYAGPLFDDNEIIEAIDSLLFGKWFTTGEKVTKFEREFSSYINAKYSLMVNSGSSANLVMLAALKKYLKWNDGDGIIVSVVGFPTTLNPIIQNNLKPIFTDIEYKTLNFDLDAVERSITPTTRGIFESPVLGNPPDIDRLLAIKKKYNIQLILDGCDSLGTKWNQKHLNEYFIASTCSFYPAHHITTGEGGMLSSNIEELVKIARSFSWWGRDCYCIGATNTANCGTCGKRFSNWIEDLPYPIDHRYFFTQIGYNLKPLDLQGGLGSAQLKKIELIHKSRKQNKNTIQQLLSKLPGVSFPEVYPYADVSWFGVPVICSSFQLKNKLINHFETNNIQTRNYFAGNILLHPAYRHLDDWQKYPNACSVLERVFFLGCAPVIRNDHLAYIAKIIETFKKIDK